MATAGAAMAAYAGPPMGRRSDLSRNRVYPPQKEPGEGLREGRECPVDAPRPRRSKRAGLARLPADWREQMWGAAPAESPYRAALAILHLAGARPAELLAGVQVVADDGKLHITMEGAKRGVDQQHGRESRTITVAIEGAQATWLFELAAAANGGMTVQIANTKRLADEVTRIGRKLWPRKKETVSPYSYRHAYAADVKAAFPDDWDTVAAALGHSVPETQRLYGRAQQSRGGGARFHGIVATASPKPDRLRKAYPSRKDKASSHPRL